MGARKNQLPMHFAWTFLAVASILIGAATVARAAPKLDVSKLKAGDKLEARFGNKWEAVEFVDFLSERHVRVKRKGWKFAVGALTRNLRQTAKTAKRGNASDVNDSATTEDPFMTQEERAELRKPRTWTDRTGKFKTEATFLRMSDEKVVLKRSDGKEISVTLARLDDADQRYVAALLGTDSGDSSHSEAAEQPADERDIELTETDLSAAEVVALAQIDTWDYQPDPARDTTPMPKVRVPLRNPKSFFDRPSGLILLPGEQKAFVVSIDRQPGSQSYDSTVQECDLEQGKLEAFSEFASSAAPLDISPDGKAVLARTVGFGFGKQNELQLYKRDGNGATPARAWSPYLQSGQSGVQAHDADVIWARFLDPDHVIAMSTGGTLSLWNTTELRPVYQAKGLGRTQPALSAGGRYVALAMSSGIAILQAIDGKLVGTLRGETGQLPTQVLAFSPNGTRLAMVQNSRVRVWDLASRKLERDFSTPARQLGTHGLSAYWLDETYLLIAGTTLVDVEHYTTVWTYTGLTAIGGLYQGRLWFIESAVRGESVLASAVVPSPAIRDKWAKIPADDLLTVKPGMGIAIDLPADGTAQDVRQHITKSLTDRGMKVVPKANLRLVGTIHPGETKTMQYHRFGALPRQTTPHKVTETVLTLSLKLGQETVWKNISKIAPPSFLRLKKDQTIDQGLAEYMHRDSKAFQSIWVPVYVARPNPDAKTDRSPSPAS